MRVIETEQHLAAFLPKVKAAKWIALDTEADSLHAYPEKLCLLQVSLAETHTLIDPLSRCDFGPFLEIVRHKPLLLHGADYDLRLLHRTFQFVPSVVFDTMWAARLLGYRAFGLSFLAEHHLGVPLEKGPQKMNWALRPLSDRMATYALNDTRYLYPLSEILQADLKAKGRSEWQAEVCARLIQECSKPRVLDPDKLWRVKGSDRLNPPAMAVLRELWVWREEEAVAANKPPYFILSHERLVALSAAVAQGELGTNLLPRNLPSKRAVRLALAMERGRKAPETSYPQPRRVIGIRLTKQQQARFDELKRVRDTRSLELGLDPTIVATKSELCRLAKGLPDNGQLMRWQRTILGLD